MFIVTDRLKKFSILLIFAFNLSACQSVLKDLPGFKLPNTKTAQRLVARNAPQSWQNALPHGGNIEVLKDWWRQFKDPLLLDLISRAQESNPTLALASTRIAQAQATQAGVYTDLMPNVDLTASASRGLQSLFFPAATMKSIGLSSAWELDLFGANRAKFIAAQARSQLEQSNWHAARISIAADIARYYVELRSCEAHKIQAEMQVELARQLKQLTAVLTQAGFQNQPSLATSESNVSQAAIDVSQYEAQCALSVKSLVALSGMSEANLINFLKSAAAKLPSPPQFKVDQIPAEYLAKRPDLQAAAFEIIAASADTDHIEARKYPKISFSGTLNLMHLKFAADPQGGNVWSIGPISVTLRIFDGGRRIANLNAAKVHYNEACQTYISKMRTAIFEAEEAMVKLDSLGQREQNAQQGVRKAEEAFESNRALYSSGFIDLLELNNAQQRVVQLRKNLLDIQRDRVLAWIGLYRAMSGEWNAQAIPS